MKNNRPKVGITTEVIHKFSEELAVNIISNTFQDESSAFNQNYKCNFNPIDRWMEALAENKKLYEALLKSEREKVEMLQRMLEGK